ncbi:MAG TPA: TolC family protein [Nitrospiria bacterium]|nr:TolC family protein [Nitrospiria bacterium]
MFRFLVFIFCLTLFVGFPFGGSSAFALTLNQAREEALQKYWGVKIAHEQAMAAESERKSRFANFFPKLSFNGNVTRYNDETDFLLPKGAIPNNFTTFPLIDTLIQFSNRDVYQFGPSLQQPVFVGGRLYFGFQQSQAWEEQAGWNEKQVVNDLLYAVEQAYLDVLQAQGEKTVAEKDLEFYKKLHSDIEKQYKAGRTTLDEVLKVQTEEGKAEEKLLSATSGLQISEGQFNLLLVRSVDAPVSIEPVSDLTPVALDLATALSAAQSYRPDLQKDVAVYNAAVYSTRIVESSYYPQVNAGAKWYRQDISPSTIDRDRWQLFLTADWTFWEWGSTKQRVAEAEAQERQAEYQVNQLSDQVQLDVHQAWVKLEESEKQIQVAARTVEHATEALRVVALGFQAGVKTSTNLIEAEALLSQAELTDLRARFAAQLARATLRHSIGIMDEESLGKVGGSN